MVCSLHVCTMVDETNRAINRSTDNSVEQQVDVGGMATKQK